MQWTDFKAALRSARWAFVGLVVVGALGGLLLDLHLDRLPDSSSVQLTVSDATGAPPSSDSASTVRSFIKNQMPTYAELATSDDVLGPAASGSGTTLDELRPEVAVAAVQDSDQLTIDVRASSPSAATAEANAVTQSVTGAITRLETPEGHPSRVAVTTTSGPTAPAARFVPPVGVLTAAGALAGALVVLLAAAAWATGLPQRGWRGFTTWLFRRPAPGELTRVPGAELHEPRDDLEQALAKQAGQLLSKRKNKD
ncbi:hypothetical protein LQ327_22720 [Actinomycetospora endophytica]|uniref:Capsular polysaccharide biosynthesis protein n=1 Tax=Actinomycetospora endophytica TaxID=2291215 RepID=A0ABS8PD36_9PSEU|nr:hypothetical protein [Actinomycetospora endophytica]MCD2196191.1 hypothetical protein [Actinomycetospora endophytica]